MSDEGVAIYLDTSALAKWYLSEAGSESFSSFIQTIDVAVVSSLTRTEMRSLLARRRRMGDIDRELESVLYSAFLDDIARGHLQLYPVDDGRLDEAANLIVLYPELPLRTLDAIHLATSRHFDIRAVATADRVMGDAAREMGMELHWFGEEP
ncbi:type II toxin-antitoxin system VapC family toxin [Endothiovibrio diazotrophicus]